MLCRIVFGCCAAIERVYCSGMILLQSYILMVCTQGLPAQHMNDDPHSTCGFIHRLEVNTLTQLAESHNGR
jgi:hypothetical protein